MNKNEKFDNEVTKATARVYSDFLSKMEKPTCRGCSFWNAFTPPRVGAHKGECRKNPPSNKEGDMLWPVTHEFAWCGAFWPK
jgi:hypothetical protein